MSNYRSVFLGVPIPAIIVGAGSGLCTILDSSDAFLSLPGVSDRLPTAPLTSSAFYSKIFKAFGDNCVALITEATQRCLAAGVRTEERIHVTVTGEFSHIGFTCIPIATVDGQVTEIVQYFSMEKSSISNYEGSKTQEPAQAVALPELGDPAILDFVMLPVWIFEEDALGILFANRAACAQYGYTQDEYQQMNLRDLWPQQDISERENVLTESFANRQNAYSNLYRHVKKNGVIIWVKIENRRLRYQGRNVRMSAAIDVSKELNVQDDLLATNQWLESAQQMAHLGYWSFDIANSAIFWSDELYRIFELNKSEGIRSLSDIISHYHPDDHETFAIDVNCYTGAPVLYFERRIRTKAGNYKWVSEKLQIKTIEGGRVTRLEGIVCDINELKNAETALKKSEELYRTLFDSSPLPIAMYDEATLQIIAVNPAACTQYGYSREEFEAMTLRDLRPTDEISALDVRLEQIREFGYSAYPHISKHQKKSGELLYARVNLTPIKIGDRSVVVATALDITSELRAQGELADANARLETAQQLGKMGYSTRDLKTKKYYWSREMYHLYELNPETFILTEDSIIERIHPDDRFIARGIIQSDVSQDHVWNVEWRVATNNNGWKWLKGVVKLSVNNGTPTKTEVVLQDITAQKYHETALRASEDKYRNLFNCNPQPTWIYDEDALTIIDVNESACRQYGYTRSEFIGMSLKNLRPAEDVPQLEEAVSQLKNKNFNNSGHMYRHKKKNDDIIFVNIISAKVFIDGRNTRMVLAIDLTERVSREKVIVESNKRLKTAQEIARLGYWTWDLKSENIRWSKEMYKLYDVDPTCFLPTAQNILSKIHPEDRGKFRLDLVQNFTENTDWEVEIRVIDGEGGTRWLYSKLQIFFEGGKPSMLEGVVMDISERKLAEQTIIRKSKLLEALNRFKASLLAGNDWVTAAEVLKEVSLTTLGLDSVFFLERWIDTDTGEDFGCVKKFWTAIEESGTGTVEPNARVPFSRFPGIAEDFKAGRSFTTTLSALPAGGLKDALNQKGIKSMMQVPILVSGNLFGYISLHDSTSERIWSEDELIFVQSVAMNVANSVEKQQAQTESEKNRKLLDSIISSLPGISIRRQAKGVWPVIFVSDEVERITGFKAADFMNNKVRSYESIIHAEDRQFVAAAIRQAQPGKLFELEYRIVCLDGKIKWLRGRGRPILDADGNVEFLDAVVLDVTDAHTQRQQLIESNERFTMVLRASDEAIMDLDVVTGNIIWGDGFHEVFGYDITGSDSTIWRKNIHPDDKQRVMAELFAVKDNNLINKHYLEFRFLRRDRTVAYVQQRGVFLRDAAGKLIRVVSAMTDVTRHVQQLNEIRQQNERLREIAWKQSHLVRRPLANLMALTDFLKNRDFGVMPETFIVDNIIKSAAELDEVIHDIVDKAGKMALV